ALPLRGRRARLAGQRLQRVGRRVRRTDAHLARRHRRDLGLLHPPPAPLTGRGRTFGPGAALRPARTVRSVTSEASPAPTRRPLTAPTAGDIRDVHDIERLVRSFYRDVAADPVLGPVFARAGTDWAHHIPRLVTFWSWQLLGHA